MHAPLSTAATEGVAFPGAITLDTLPDLFAHHGARFGGWSMEKKDDDGEGEEEEEVDDPGDDDPDDGDGELDDPDDDDPDDGDGKLDEKGKKALAAERAKVKELRKRLAEAQRAGKKKDADDDTDDDDAEEKAAAKWKPKVVNSAARAAFMEAGADRPERLLKLLDHDELDVSDDGEVEGLDEEVDRLKEEYPELFTKPKRAGRRVETGDRSGGSSTKKKLSATERQARALAGKG